MGTPPAYLEIDALFHAHIQKKGLILIKIGKMHHSEMFYKMIEE